MKRIALVAALTGLSLLSFSTSFPVGPVSYSTPVSWSGTDSVIVNGIITIRNGGTLTIAPGMKVVFAGDNYQIRIQGTGRLLAIGTETDSIVFTPQDKINKSWQGIRITGMDVAADSSILDYCIIEYAYADNTDAELGGGIYMANGTDFSKMRISNSTFRYNSAISLGGAIYCFRSSPVIKNCTFFQNSVRDYSGGAICGAMSSPVISNCRIINNSAAHHGGGMHFENNSSPTIRNTLFNNNTSLIGGAISCVYYANPVISGNMITNNHSSGYGGGIHCENYSSPMISNNTLTNNTGGFGGGAISCIYYAYPVITGNTIGNNAATEYGGAIHIENFAYPTLINNTINTNNCS